MGNETSVPLVSFPPDNNYRARTLESKFAHSVTNPYHHIHVLLTATSLSYTHTHMRYTLEVDTLGQDRKASTFLNRAMIKRDTAKTTHQSDE